MNSKWHLHSILLHVPKNNLVLWVFYNQVPSKSFFFFFSDFLLDVICVLNRSEFKKKYFGLDWKIVLKVHILHGRKMRLTMRKRKISKFWNYLCPNKWKIIKLWISAIGHTLKAYVNRGKLIKSNTEARTNVYSVKSYVSFRYLPPVITTLLGTVGAQ